MGAKFEAIKHATSTGIMWHCENNLEQGSRIQDIANSYTEEPIQDGKRLVSSKEDSGNHGWGLESVKDTVKKYDGIIEISYRNQKFVVEIVFTN